MDPLMAINQHTFIDLNDTSQKKSIQQQQPPELLQPPPAAPPVAAAAPVKKSRRGRKPSKIDVKTKLERSRQSARECRARKKLRYQYVEDLVCTREKAILALRNELETYKKWCQKLDQGIVPAESLKFVRKQCEESLDPIEEEEDVVMDTSSQETVDSGIDVPAD